MQVISHTETLPRLGIVLLDLPHQSADFGLFEPDDPVGLTRFPVGWFEAPGTWPVPTAFAVAPNAGAAATLRGDRAAANGVRSAVNRLAPVSDLIIGDCGFFWAARDRSFVANGPPVLLSSLDLLELAGQGTGRDIAVLTFSAPDLEQLLATHPLRGRLRIVGVSDLPTWGLLAEEAYGVDPRWTTDDLRNELLGRVSECMDDGTLGEVGSVLLECTVMPQFREALRSLTSLPIIDVASTALALLDAGERSGTNLRIQPSTPRRERTASGSPS